MIKRLYPYIIAIICCLYPAKAGAQEGLSLQEKIAALTEGDVLGQAVVGICARTGDGNTLVDINASDMMTPASNMKLITTGAALHALGGDYRFETEIRYRRVHTLQVYCVSGTGYAHRFLLYRQSGLLRGRVFQSF